MSAYQSSGRRRWARRAASGTRQRAVGQGVARSEAPAPDSSSRSLRARVSHCGCAIRLARTEERGVFRHGIAHPDWPALLEEVGRLPTCYVGAAREMFTGRGKRGESAVPGRSSVLFRTSCLRPQNVWQIITVLACHEIKFTLMELRRRSPGKSSSAARLRGKVTVAGPWPPPHHQFGVR